MTADEGLLKHGISAAPVTAWLTSALPESEPPYRFELIAAGGSNLTFRVTDASGECFALRRPPVKGQLESAHDMQREWRILEALTPTAVPVPRALAYCADQSVTGSEFYLMAFAEGRILRNPQDAAALTAAEKTTATRSLIDIQVALHQLDVDAVGLGGLGHREQYLQRQIYRWRKQVEAAPVRDLPAIGDLGDCLSQCLPSDQGVVSIVHGDYRFDNTVLNECAEVCAVLDWELCTLGDPVADFFWSSMYWGRPDDQPPFIRDMPTEASGFCERDDIISQYARLTGYDLSARPWYEAFSWWKMACIVEGVYARMLKGGTGGRGAARAEMVAAMVDGFLSEAGRRIARL